MGRHYSTRDFFRQMPNELLARYFEGRAALAGIKETQPEPLFEAWLELPEIQRNAMDSDFREIHTLSSERGWCAIRDEAEWHLRESPALYAAQAEGISAPARIGA